MTAERADMDVLASGVSQILEAPYRRLESLAAIVAESHPTDGGWTERQLAPVAEAAVAMLAEDPITAGFGYVATPGDVDGRERFMAWWQRSGNHISRLRLNFDPTSIDVYDYLQMEWFQLARDGRRRVAYGPYVDYSGAGLYIVTATVPVLVDHRFVGVVGADLVVDELERRMVAVLQTVPNEAVVVSGERRVIAANTPRWVVGARLPEMPTSDIHDSEFSQVFELQVGTGWVVAVTKM